MRGTDGGGEGMMTEGKTRTQTWSTIVGSPA